jgi:hypothetical protein
MESDQTTVEIIYALRKNKKKKKIVWTKTNTILVFANPPSKPNLVLCDNLVFTKLKTAFKCIQFELHDNSQKNVLTVMT